MGCKGGKRITIPILIDTDPAIGIFGADVDDALAILLALNSDELEVDGLTAVFGNTDVNRASRIAKEILTVANRNDIQVYKGAYNASWLGVRTPAVNFLINHVMEHPGEITLITLAPLTNVATAILLEPKFIENLKALLMMGGLFFPSNMGFPFLQAEFNFSRDPKATQIVVSQDIENTIIGLDLTTKVLFKDAHFNALKAGNTQITNYLTKKIKSWLVLNKLLMGGFNPHDPLCVAYLLNRSLYREITASVEVEVPKERKHPEVISKKYSNSLLTSLSSLLSKKGRLKVMVPPFDSRKNKIRVCTKIDGNRFLELLIQRLSKG